MHKAMLLWQDLFCEVICGVQSAADMLPQLQSEMQSSTGKKSPLMQRAARGRDSPSSAGLVAGPSLFTLWLAEQRVLDHFLGAEWLQLIAHGILPADTVCVCVCGLGGLHAACPSQRFRHALAQTTLDRSCTG